MKNQLIFSKLFLVVFIFGCSSNHKESAYMSSPADEARAATDSVLVGNSNSNGFISSSAAKENNKDSTRKFIRTAELKFKVKNVRTATYAIESITRKFNGFVTYTNLTSNINHVTTVPVSSDSSLENTFFNVENNITIRVPNTKLDTTLMEISKWITFLDYRIIKADDVGIQLLANKMTERRVKKHETRLTDAIDNRGKKLYETTDAEENLLSKQEQADQAKISNLALMDQVNFSTIQLYIYQRPDINRELIANEKNIEEYEPGFFYKVKDSIFSGWKILESIFLFFVNIWGILLILLLIFILLKKYGHKINKSR